MATVSSSGWINHGLSPLKHLARPGHGSAPARPNQALKTGRVEDSARRSPRMKVMKTLKHVAGLSSLSADPKTDKHLSSSSPGKSKTGGISRHHRHSTDDG